MKYKCPKCNAYTFVNEKKATCTRCDWIGLVADCVIVEPLGKRIVAWIRNAYLRTLLKIATYRKRREIEHIYKEEAKSEGAFSYIPVIDQHIEQMLVSRLQHFGFDPGDSRTFIDHLKVALRPSSLTWEIDGKPIMSLAWSDKSGGEIIYRLKEVNASRLTLVQKPKDIAAPSGGEIKIVNHG